MTKPELYLLAGGAVIAAYLFSNKSAADFGQSAGSAAVNLVDGVLSGGVIAIGELVGVPPTNKTLGQVQLENGQYWDASFSLPAGEFISGMWKKITQ